MFSVPCRCNCILINFINIVIILYFYVHFRPMICCFFFFLNDPAPPEFSPLPLHAPLPISVRAPAPPGSSGGSAGATHPGGGSEGVVEAPSDSLAERFPQLAREDLDRAARAAGKRSEEHTSELQSQSNLVCRLLLEKKKRPT